MKKKLTSILALALAASMVFTACQSGGNASSGGGSSKDDGKSSKGESSSEDGGIFTPNGEYPILKEGESMEISVFAPLRGAVTDYSPENNTMTKYFEDYTGITFDWQAVPDADRVARLNTLMQTGSYPDVIINSFWSQSEQLLYGTQGDIIPLNDLIAEYSPNLVKAYEEAPLVKNNMVMPDGNMYSLPQIGTAQHMIAQYKMWINVDWIEAAGLEMPQTTEDFEKVLKAFKEQDVNGNGDPNDEVPLSGSIPGWNTFAPQFLLNSFTYYSNQSKWMYVGDDGKIVYTRTTDEIKEGIKWLRSLCEQGLLDPLMFTQTADNLKAIGNSPDVPTLGAYTGGSVASCIDIGGSDRWLQYKTMPPLEGPEGVRNAILYPDFGNAVLSITKSATADEAIAVIRAFDTMFEGTPYTAESMFYRNIMGEEGIDYVAAGPEDKNQIGEPAAFTRLTNDAERDGRYWNQLGPWYRVTPDYELLFTSDPKGDIETTLFNETVNNYLPYHPDESIVLPPLSFDEDASRRIVDIEQNINTCFDEALAAFVTGTRDIDAEWDKYVADMKAYGVEEYVELYQASYDTKMGK